MRLDRVSKEGVAVVALASQGGEGFQLFMFRHRPKAAEQTEALTFPSGTVKKEDCLERIAGCCMGLEGASARRILGSELAPENALGFWVAAARILYEENGILLCTTMDGRSPDLGGGTPERKLRDKHRLLTDGNLDFMTFLESEGLCCDLGRLAYFSQWSSGGLGLPSVGIRTFFARLPYPIQSPLDSDSAREPLWITPENALELLDQGGIHTDFPTFSTLRLLADFDSLETLWGEYGIPESPSEK